MAGKKEKTRRTRKRSSFMEEFDKEKRNMKNVSYFKRHTRKVTKPRGLKRNQRSIEEKVPREEKTQWEFLLESFGWRG